MSTYQKIDRHWSMDPDIWEVYEEIWDKLSELRKSPYSREYTVGYEAQVSVLEKLLQKYVGAQYRRKGEPTRVTIADVIAYHEGLDRKYLGEQDVKEG